MIKSCSFSPLYTSTRVIACEVQSHSFVSCPDLQDPKKLFLGMITLHVDE